LVAPPALGRDDVRNLSGRHPLEGARAANLLPGVADQLGIDAGDEGVVVLSVRNGSTAARLGFRRGDIVQEVSHQKIANVLDLDRALAKPQRLWLMVIRRGEQLLQLQIGG
jgi:S1-C subfamily serine protease